MLSKKFLHIVVLFALIVSMSVGISGCSCKDSKKKGEEVLLETPDLTLFGLKGHVKSMKDEEGKTIRFSSEGLLQLEGGDIERDDKERIVRMKSKDIETSFRWDKSGKMVESNRAALHNTYWYDDRGLVVCCVTEVDTWEMSAYRYLEFDQSGNWIKRERLYRGIRSSAEEGADPTYKGLVTEKRDIRYY